MRRIAAVIERRPAVAELSTPESAAAHDLIDRARSVVYLESAPRGAFEQSEPGRAAMDQRNETFVPHVLAITTGTTVDFPNSDRIYHNVFSLSKTKRFDLGRYPVGHSRPVRFDQPGIVRVFSFEQDATTAAIVMEHVEGQTLAQKKAQRESRCFDCDEILPWLEQASANDHHVVHASH